MSKSNGILVTTEYVQEKLVRPLITLAPELFLILPCGVDVKEFNPENIGTIKSKYGLEGDYVICPGALSKMKGPQNIVEASKVYCHLAKTIFIGMGDLEEELKENLGDRGQFLGFVSSEDKAQLINAAAILTAAPEKLEHFGIVYVEALAGGVPPVAYEGGGVSDIINSEVGALVKRDPKLLGEKILSLLENHDKRKQMGSAGRKRAIEFFCYDLIVKRLENWLEKLV